MAEELPFLEDQMKNIIIIVTMVLLLATTGYCATYYVNGQSGLDSNPGTINSPWETIYKANQTLVAGDTVYIRGGISSFQTYNITTNSGTGEGIKPTHSGTSGNLITYSVYPGEKVELVGNGKGGLAGVYIVGHDYIKVTGYDGSTSAMNLKVRNVAFPFWIGDGKTTWDASAIGSNYCEISYVEFGANDTASTFWGEVPGCKLFYHSTYNWIHHCSIHDHGGYSTADSGYNLEIGRDTCGTTGGVIDYCEDTTGYNVVENNKIYHGGHHTIGINMNHNVVRNNVFHNEQWYKATDNNYYGYRVIYFSGDHNPVSHYAHYQNLFEGNTVSHSALNYRNDSSLKALVQLSNAQNILRNNYFYAGDGWGFYIEAHSGASNVMYARENKIYNNTFFSIGYGSGRPPGSVGIVTTSDPADRNPMYFVSGYNSAQYLSNFASSYDAPTWNGSMWVGSGKGSIYGNVVKNNLFWKTYSGLASPNYREIVTMMKGNASPWGSFTNACSSLGQTYCGDTVISNNWTTSNLSSTGYGPTAFTGHGDPKFVSEGSYGSPSINSSSNWEWYFVTAGNPTPPVDITTVAGLTQPDLRLTSSSPVIDQGANLTTAVGAGSNSSTLVVADAKYFQPGWGNGAGGGASVAADWIAIGTVTNVVQISSINYNTNTITLKSPMTWSNGAKVWLYRKSDGNRVLYGAAPENGAYEFGSDVTAPGPPTLIP
jgi:hypothetical protein